MENSLGKEWVLKWKGKGFRYGLVGAILYALASTLLLSAALSFFYAQTWWIPVLFFFLFLIVYVYISGVDKVSLLETAFQLDARFPELEHSTSLFLKPSSSLGLLQQLQAKKIEQRLIGLDVQRNDFPKRLYRPILFLLFSLLLYAGCSYFQYLALQRSSDTIEKAQAVRLEKEDVSLQAAFTDVELLIHPPAYTGLPEQVQNDLAISAAMGSTIEIHLHTNTKMEQIALLFDGKNEVKAEKVDSLIWKAKFNPQKSGFYQLSYDGQASPLYPIEIIPDRPVTIQVLRPEPRTLIEAGVQPLTTLEAHLSDDYGIQHATLMTTLTSGKGESVSFKSAETALADGKGVSRNMDIKHRMDLKSLDMKPGDELYFYVRALDNAGQESRSDVYVISLQDTAELMSMSGVVSGSDVAPEYFRSQRQIIIDIEKLLDEMPGIVKDEAQNRSNNLGVDQKLLRLRYGQFLGEEAEGDLAGSDHDHEGADHDHGEGESHQPKTVSELQDEVTHHHDQAEDATFFTPEQKAQLKATLTEMWNSELKLRTFQPQEALPYAYKALRLLKELQQQSRVYVSKASTKATPLQPEKRLSGDLDEILNPSFKYRVKEMQKPDEQVQHLRQALTYLSNLSEGGMLDDQGLQLLGSLQEHLIAGAAVSPDRYLKALKAVREIEEENGRYDSSSVQVIAKAIQELLPTLLHQPAMKQPIGKESIYNSYLNSISNN